MIIISGGSDCNRYQGGLIYGESDHEAIQKSLVENDQSDITDDVI